MVKNVNHKIMPHITKSQVVRPSGRYLESLIVFVTGILFLLSLQDKNIGLCSYATILNLSISVDKNEICSIILLLTRIFSDFTQSR